MMYSSSDKRWTLFSLLCSTFDEEKPEVPLLFRDVPSLLIIFVLTMPQPLRKGTAFKATSGHDTRGRRVGGWVPEWPLHNDSPVISANQVWVLKRNLSHLLSVQLLLFFDGEGQRQGTLMMGGLQLLCVLHFCPVTLLEKVQGHLRISPAYLGYALMQVHHFSNDRIRLQRTFEIWTLERLPL